MKAFASLIAALMVLAAACASAQSPDYERAGVQWNAMLTVLVEQATNYPTTYHNPEHDAARVEAMRASVVESRAHFEARIRELRTEIEAETYGAAIVERQLRALDRYEALAALMERTRLAAIAGDIEARRSWKIVNTALFGEIDWTFAEHMETLPPEHGADATPLMTAIALDFRVQAWVAFARRDILLGDAEGVAAAHARLREIAPAFRALADDVEAVAELVPAEVMDMSAEDRARRAAFLAGAPSHMRDHALSIEQLADALSTATPETVDEFSAQTFVDRYPLAPENEVSP